MSPFLKKWVARPLIILTTTLVLIMAVILVIVSTQQERLVNLAVEKLNKEFKGELVISESSVSLFRNFPYVSIVIHDGRFFPDKSRAGQPLAEFERLYVGFSISDLLNGTYKVRRLILNTGYADLSRNENGSIDLLEPASERSKEKTSAPQHADTTSLALQLEHVMVNDMNVSFTDKQSGQKVRTNISRMMASFDIDSTRLAFTTAGDMKLDVMMAGGDSTLFSDKAFHLDLAALYYFNPAKFAISSCRFTLEEAGFNVTGHALTSDTTDVDFRIKGDNQDFNLFTAFLPSDTKQKLAPFQYDGRLHFDASVKGKVAENVLPLIEVKFGCEEAWFLNTTANRKVDQLGFSGFFTNGKDHSLQTSEVHIINVSARPEKGIFKGHFVVRDFTQPQAVVRINSELELKFLGEFFGIQDLKQMTGTIKLDMDFKEVHDIVLPEESLNKLKEGIQSRLVVQDLSFRIPGYPHAVRDMNIHAQMRDGKVTVDSAVLKIGKSDLKLKGSISDVRAFLREREKPIRLTLQAKSNQVVLSDLLSYDTALARQWNEQVNGFNVALAFETTVNELLNPNPLPRGTFEMKNLRGTFTNYAHTFKDLGATVLINDTLLRLRDFTGMIDSSDINFKGRVTNYRLWFDDIKKGRTQIAFDFKSERFAIRDVFGKEIRRHLPRGYRREELRNVWLRTKIDLRYDTVFRFAKAKVANVTAELKKHNLKLHSISGGVKYGSRILSFDTLRGKIGNSDFDINLKYYFQGIDRYGNKVSNSLRFASRLLDIDEMSRYDLAPKTGKVVRDSTGRFVRIEPDSSRHAQAFNIFMIPFSDFNTEIAIGKVKYNRLWLKDVNAKVTMRPDQTITFDTLTLRVAGGSVAMRGKFNGANHEKIYFRSRIKFEQVDLGKMMLKLDHFGQDVVVNKNVKGKVSGQIRSYVQVHPDLVPILANSKADMNLKIYDGTLVDFAPMQAMASYFKDKNLRLIRFDTLSNRLSFTNGVLDIPAMDINSSIGYIQLSGRQSMDLAMEYYLRVPMKLVTKAGFSALFNRKQEDVDLSQVDEIEYVDKDRKVAFMNLKVTGTPDGNIEVGLGRDRGKKKVL